MSLRSQNLQIPLRQLASKQARKQTVIGNRDTVETRPGIAGTVWWAVLFVVLTSTVILPVHAQQTKELTVTAVLSTQQVKLGQPFDFTVQVSWSGLPFDFMVHAPRKLELSELEQLESSVSNQTVEESGIYQVKRLYRYRFLPRKEGEATIGSIVVPYQQRMPDTEVDGEKQVNYSDEQTLSTSPLTLTVLPPPRTITVPWRALLSVLVLTVLIYVFFNFFKKKKQEEVPLDIEEEVNPVVVFRDTLKDNERLLLEGEFKEFYVRMEKALLTLLEEVSGKSLSGLAGPEVVRKVEAVVASEEDRQTIVAFLEAANLVKFAGMNPERDELDRLVRALGRVSTSLDAYRTEDAENSGN